MNYSSKNSKQPGLITGVILILALLFLISFSGSLPVLHLFGLNKLNGTIFFISRILYWICLGIIWLYSIKVEKQKLLIWYEKKYSFGTYLLMALIIFVILIAGQLVIAKLISFAKIKTTSVRLSEIVDIMRSNKLLLLFTCITAGIVEELIFRGYLQPRLEIIFKSSTLAIIFSSLFFGLMHYNYGTVLNVTGPFFIGLVFAFFYWKYRNIKLLSVFHFLWDLAGLLIALKFHK